MAFFILTARCCHCYAVVSCLTACYLCPLIWACHRESVSGYKTNTLHTLTQPVMQIVNEPRLGQSHFVRQWEITLQISVSYIITLNAWFPPGNHSAEPPILMNIVASSVQSVVNDSRNTIATLVCYEVFYVMEVYFF